MRTCRRVEQCVENRPIRDRVAAVTHRLGLAIGGCDAPGVEMIATDHDRRSHRSGAHQFVEGEPSFGAIAEAKPADSRRQALKRDALPSETNPACQRGIAGKKVEQL